MSRILSLPLAVAVLAAFGANVSNAAGNPTADVPGGQQASIAASSTQSAERLSPAQRGQIAREFVTKWAPYFEAAYGQPADRWAMKQAREIGVADAANVRNAMQKTTLEAALLALSGQNISDAKVIDHLAAKDGSGTMSLGDLAADLVFTPLAPCRIFDTRSVGGIVPSAGTRSYDFYPFGSNVNFAYQGGTAGGNCGMHPDAAAVALNIAAPGSPIGGFITVYPYGTTRPLASNLDYSAGDLANNEILAKSANGVFDISVYVHGSSHIVGDVVGYYIRPQATALECVETANTDLSIAAGGTGNAVAPACAATYTQTSTNCESSTWQMPFVYFQSGTCSAQNNSASNATLRASRTCCRVPGR